MDVAAAALEKVGSLFADAIVRSDYRGAQKHVEVKRERVRDLLTFLKGDPELSFECLTDLTAVDYLNQGTPERFCVVYVLYSFKNNGYFRVQAWVPEPDPSIDSACGVWKSANWAEREVFDLYGIEFRGHPNLKRLLMPEYYTGHPLRKDYPLRGLGERDSFPRYVEEA